MRLFLSSCQWAMFILAGTVVAPLAIGQAYGMTPGEIADFVQRTFLVLGVVSLLQALWGHRLPIMEGPAALWWGVFLLFASLGPAMGLEQREVLPALAMGLLASGLIFIAAGALGWMDSIRRLFSPTVIGTYFLLLVAQMSGPFLNGIFMTRDDGATGTGIAISLGTLVLTLVLARSKIMLLRSYSVLIAILFGWILFVAAGIYHPIEGGAHTLLSFPEMMAWGWPQWNSGIILTSLIVTLLLFSNLIASLEAVEQVVQPKEEVNANRSGFLMGVSQLLSTAFSTIGFVPLSYTAGFILTTRIKDKLPFILGSLAVMMMSFFPFVTVLFASIPVSVGYASVFLSFANMLGMGIREVSRGGLGERQMFIVGVSLMCGTGTMFFPATFLSVLPPYISPLLSNGLLMGVLICMVMERLMQPERITATKEWSQ
ncbi:purine/pyrimidine permease [Brevibacillus ruminantium]|uniref:Purine/pyrimidine permease n=1 Tax=Brevibacillus ruminantium TaxID=2950604 RepID=A0ABY4WQS0_9BACL|nr:purine/pyrimidine permease [Brevibacillus ruminantium]USG68215.1 purine/pyrimidine permease [Brevibacillus ruminantium]